MKTLNSSVINNVVYILLICFYSLFWCVNAKAENTISENDKFLVEIILSINYVLASEYDVKTTVRYCSGRFENLGNRAEDPIKIWESDNNKYVELALNSKKKIYDFYKRNRCDSCFLKLNLMTGAIIPLTGDNRVKIIKKSSEQDAYKLCRYYINSVISKKLNIDKNKVSVLRELK